jgi:hypothetical protein
MYCEEASGISGSGRRADAEGVGEQIRIGGLVGTDRRSRRSGGRGRRRSVFDLSGRSGGAGANQTRGVVVRIRVVMGRETRQGGEMENGEQRCRDAKRRSRFPWLPSVSHDTAPRSVRRFEDRGFFRSRVTGTARRKRTYYSRGGIQAQIRPSAPLGGARRPRGWPAGPPTWRRFRVSKTGCPYGADVLSISHSSTRRLVLQRLRENAEGVARRTVRAPAEDGCRTSARRSAGAPRSPL